MNITKETTTDELLERRAAIAEECEKPEADLDALTEEVRAINAELETRRDNEEKRAALRKNVAAGAGTEIEKKKGGEKTHGKKVTRDSPEYIDAYAEYIKSEDATECRALLTENVDTGTVAVPTIASEIVRHAWESDEILKRVRKTYFKGNFKVQFEISSTGAVKHTEGGDAVAAETLVLGIVNLIPASFKKWVPISDEAMDMRGEAFLRYIYEEVTHHIAKAIADEIVADIIAAPATSTTTAVGVPVLTATGVSVGLIAGALGMLSDEATNPVVIINRASWAEFKTAQYAGNFEVDPFEGLPVIYNNTITAAAAATTGVTFAIVGDLGNGALVNLPKGDGIEFKVDDKTEMTKDIVRVLGREYAAVGVVGPGQFVKIAKPAAQAG